MIYIVRQQTTSYELEAPGFGQTHDGGIEHACDLKP